MTPIELHRAAMSACDEAESATRRGEDPLPHNERALSLEINAATMVREEPWRSIFYRSAAWIAVECAHYDEATRLAEAGLAGEPPADIEAELRHVVLTARMARRQHRHQGRERWLVRAIVTCAIGAAVSSIALAALIHAGSP